MAVDRPKEYRWCVGCGTLCDADLAFCSESCGDTFFEAEGAMNVLIRVGFTKRERRVLLGVRGAILLDRPEYSEFRVRS